MKTVAVIGSGYVGLTLAVGLADLGHNVTGCDRDVEKIARLKKGESPIYEPGLTDYLHKNLSNGNLNFSSDSAAAVKNSEIVFIAVGTPSASDGSVDLSALTAAAETIAENLDGYKVIVIKSTVAVGTNSNVAAQIRKLRPEAHFSLVSNPEFLREGKAMQDFFHPDRIVIGYDSENAREIMEELYRPLFLISVPFCWCSPVTAELIKYASNAFLATKIAFINELANLAAAVGGDIHDVAQAMGMDGRISSKFLHPGPGFGGSCFPKDVRALAAIGEQVGAPLRLVGQVIDSNEKQKQMVVDQAIGLLREPAGKIVTVLGLAFKAETDDIRESPAILIIRGLLEKGVKIQAHDPKAAENFRALFPQIEYFDDRYQALKGSSLLLILTEWNEYRSLDLAKAADLMAEKKIFDCRNILSPQQAVSSGFQYCGIGRGFTEDGNQKTDYGQVMPGL